MSGRRKRNRSNQALKLASIVWCIAVALAFSSCMPEGPHWWEGDRAVLIGKGGGTRKVVDGIDVWINGEPPRKFRVLVMVGDVRPGGPPSPAELDHDIVSNVRQWKGDAAMTVSPSSRIVNWSKPPIPARSRFAVIKYLD